MVKLLFSIYDKTKWFFEIFWLFMELHLIKVVLIIAFLLGIYEVCLCSFCLGMNFFSFRGFCSFVFRYQPFILLLLC